MLKVAILDDYQNVSQAFLNLQKLDGKYEFKIFNQSFLNEDDAGKQLKDFEALLIMRERTRITKFLIDRLTKLKFIITRGMRNNAIDLKAAKQKKIITQCGERSPKFVIKIYNYMEQPASRARRSKIINCHRRGGARPG